jgi:hypothetical protein
VLQHTRNQNSNTDMMQGTLQGKLTAQLHDCGSCKRTSMTTSPAVSASQANNPQPLVVVRFKLTLPPAPNPPTPGLMPAQLSVPDLPDRYARCSANKQAQQYE